MSLNARLRGELIEAILKTPVADDYKGRTTLLAGISIGRTFQRDESNSFKDVSLIVMQLEDGLAEHGDRGLVQLIDNALANNIRETTLGDTLQSIRATLEELRSRARARSAEIGQVYLFDLRALAMKCISSLPDRGGGVFGFAVPVPAATEQLLEYFCESLRYRGEKNDYWQREQVMTPNELLVVAPLRMSVGAAIERVKKAKALLARKHVLWPISIENEADAAPLWQGMKSAFTDPLTRYLVIVFGVPETAALPDGIIPLPPPTFMEDDVSRWMEDIVRAKAWDKVVVERFTRAIVRDAPGDSPLPIRDTYDRLKSYHKLLTEHETDEALLNALTESEQLT